MYWRSSCLLMGALLFGGGVHAQEMPTLARSAVWALVKPAMMQISESEFGAMFQSGVAAPTESGYAYVSTFDVNGAVFTASVTGGNAIYAWGYAAANDYGGDVPFQCWMVGRCYGAAVFGSEDSGGYTFTVSDSFGSTGSRFTIGKYTDMQGKDHYRASVGNSSSGDLRGVRDIFNGNTFISTCGGGWTGTSSYFDSYGEALSQVTARITSVGHMWAMAAPACVRFVQYLSLTGTEVPGWQYAIEDAARRNLNPLSFVTIEGIEVSDDTPPPPDPNAPNDADGDGIPDTQDQYPYDPSNTPPQSNWDVTPIDEGTGCRAIDIPCNLKKLFLPQIDWPSEMQEMRTTLLQKVPFGYVAWLEFPSAGGGSSALCSLTFAEIQIRVCDNAIYTWWTGTAKYWLLAPMWFACIVWLVRIPLA